MAIFYADQMTNSMKRAIDETNRRRQVQIAFNEAHGITPKGIHKEIVDLIDGVYNAEDVKKLQEKSTSTQNIEP